LTQELTTLETALKNARKPSYDLHILCPKCGKESTTNNGEWLIWCGKEEHAKAILKAARGYLKLLKDIKSNKLKIVPDVNNCFSGNKDLYGKINTLFFEIYNQPSTCLWDSIPEEDKFKPMGLCCPCRKCRSY